MKCPKCKKGDLTEHKAIVTPLFRFSKYVYTYFCPLCVFEIKKEMKMSWSEACEYQEHVLSKKQKIEISKPRWP